MNSSLEKTAEENEGDDLFYFESDHLALKGNKDYSEILKTLFVLEAQRERAIKDYNAVVDIWKKCLDDPEDFLENIKTGNSLGVPDLQRVIEVPAINWSKYNVKIPEAGLKFLNSSKPLKVEKIKDEDLEKTKHIRNTHNKPWTTEEQKRLEELLVIYPPEPIELRRFKKIAAALGNRTVQQVTSRVQKYFLKLYKAGLPIPGRIPKSAEKYKKSLLHKHQRHNHYLWKPTTFFPDLNIPVVMGENDEVPGPSTSSNTTELNSSNYLLPSGYQNRGEEVVSKNTIDLQLDLLRRVKMEKQREESLSGELYVHESYQCDFCKEEPIVGSRWHCETCTDKSIDFCTDCIITQMYSDNCHPLSHKLIVLQDDRTSVSVTNSDFESMSDSDLEKSDVSYNSESNTQNSNLIGVENCETRNEHMSELDSVQNTSLVENGQNPSLEQTNFVSYNYTTIDSNYFDSEQNLNSVELFDMEYPIFSDPQNISYDYLHTNMLLDDT